MENGGAWADAIAGVVQIIGTWLVQRMVESSGKGVEGILPVLQGLARRSDLPQIAKELER